MDANDIVNKKTKASAVINERGHFVNKQGLKLKTYHVDAKEEKAVAIGFHGYASFAENDFFSCPDFTYEGSVTETLNKAGVSLRLFDMQGFGESESFQGRRAYVNRFEDYVDDAVQYFNLVKETTDLPIYLCGGSFGGCVAAHAAIELGDRCAGIVLASAMLSVENNKKQNAHLLPVLNALNCLVPSLGLAAQEPNIKFPEMVCTDERQYQGKLRVRMAVEMLKAVDDMYEIGHKVQCPMLLLHCEADTMCEPEGSQRLYQRANSKDKEIHIFPDDGKLWHAILGEPGKEKPLQKLSEWFNKRLNEPENEPENQAAHIEQSTSHACVQSA